MPIRLGLGLGLALALALGLGLALALALALGLRLWPNPNPTRILTRCASSLQPQLDALMRYCWQPTLDAAEALRGHPNPSPKPSPNPKPHPHPHPHLHPHPHPHPYPRPRPHPHPHPHQALLRPRVAQRPSNQPANFSWDVVIAQLQTMHRIGTGRRPLFRFM